MIVFVLLMFVGLLYFLFIYYLVTNGFRDYQRFCSSYIPQIDAYKTHHGVYPQTILDFKKPAFSWRYDSTECGYVAASDSFSFAVSDGLFGVAFYLSTDKHWVYD